MKPKLGQQLFSLRISRATRDRKPEFTPVEVIKVGRKYFTCKGVGRGGETQYLIENWAEKTEYTASSRLYADKQSYHDGEERDDLYCKVRRTFDYFHGNKALTLEQLREISNIIDRRETELWRD